MSKKTKINVEKKVERLNIPYGEEMITIKEPSDKLRQELLTMIVDSIQQKEDIDEKKIFNKVLDECANVEFEIPILEVEHLTHEGQMIANEITLIISEIIQEAYQLILMVMQQTKNELIQKDILKEKDIVEAMIKNKEEKEEIKIDINPMEEEKVRPIKKPNRGRRNVR